MSKPSEPDRDVLDVDTELEQACAELDSRIPDGFFERFSSKLAATLDSTGLKETAALPEGETMQSTEEAKRDEHSGLHEIKALADTARERITRRKASESDVDDWLSTSSPSLEAVVLPDPEKEISFDSVEHTQPGRAAARPAKPSPWLWAAAATAALAAAAAVALFLLSDRGGDEVARGDDSVAAGNAELGGRAAEPAENRPADRTAPAKAPAVTPLAADEQQAGEPEASEDSDDVAADRGAGGAAAAAAPSGETPTASAAPAPAPPPPADRAETRGAGAAPKAPARSRSRKRSRDDKPARERRSKHAAAKTTARANAKPKGKAKDGTKSIDDILDEVVGDTKAEGHEAKKEKAAGDQPARARLSTSDLRAAMSHLKGRVKACQRKTGYTGRVTMKFTVQPSGKVSAARPASSVDGAVGRCLSAAVRGAHFPAFRPPEMSFRFSFLLVD